MGLFFDVKTPADRKLLEGYDKAVERFRTEVSAAMDAAAEAAPSLAGVLHTAAEALRARPLPSEANADEAALRRLTLSSLTVEMAFSKLQSLADGPEAMQEAMGVVRRMREIGRETTGSPEFRPLTQAVLAAVAERRPDVAREMEEKTLALHLAELKKPAPVICKQPKPPGPKL